MFTLIIAVVSVLASPCAIYQRDRCGRRLPSIEGKYLLSCCLMIPAFCDLIDVLCLPLFLLVIPPLYLTVQMLAYYGN